jgi:Domain of unknown function (DUF1996)
MLRAGIRASACLPETPNRGPREASPNGTPSASAATRPRTSEETTMRHAQTTPLTASTCRTKLVLAGCEQLSDSQRKFQTCTLLLLHIRFQNWHWLIGMDYFSCWDGVNLDSTDHTTHVSYPASGTFETNGPCPATHPVKLPQLMFEVVWDMSGFNDKSLWPADGSQPFVLSMDDK